MPDYDLRPRKDESGQPNQGTRDKAVQLIWELVDKAEEGAATLNLLGPDATEQEQKALATAEQLINGAVQAALGRSGKEQSLYFDEKKAMHDSARSADEEAGSLLSRLEREHKVDPRLTELRQTPQKEKEDWAAHKETKTFEVDLTPPTNNLEEITAKKSL